MTKLLLILIYFPAIAGPLVRWAGRPTNEIKAVVSSLRECGVEGRVLLWRAYRAWHPKMLVTHLPARMGACRAPWIFLHDDEMRARLRSFTLTHEGLLLNLRAIGGMDPGRGEGDWGFADLLELEPAIHKAVLQISADTDIYRLKGVLRRFEDLTYDKLNTFEDRLRMMKLPRHLLEPTVNFVREARVAAATAIALRKAKRAIEFHSMDDYSIEAISDPVEHREQRLREVLDHVNSLLPAFKKAYETVHAPGYERLRPYYDLYFADALPPEALVALELGGRFAKCARGLNPISAVGL